MSEVSVSEWNKRQRDTEQKLLDLHTKLDAALVPGGTTGDLVVVAMTKGELALLMVTIEHSL